MSSSGYSGKPLAQKLGLKPGMSVVPIHAPANYRQLLGAIPKGVQFRKMHEQADVLHYFCTKRAALAHDLPGLRNRIRDDAMLWVSWPKKSSGVSSDVAEDVVREIALTLGLVDTKVCAVDETWSALRLVVRLANRKTVRRP